MMTRAGSKWLSVRSIVSDEKPGRWTVGKQCRESNRNSSSAFRSREEKGVFDYFPVNIELTLEDLETRIATTINK